MTIRKGVEWGAPVGDRRLGLQSVATDADAAQRLLRGTLGPVPAVVALTGGQVWKQLGGPSVPGRWQTAEALMFPVDLGVAAIDETTIPFVNSLVVRSRLARQGTACMNGQRYGSLLLGHRSHLNDGRLDIVQWRLALAELPAVLRRARMGAHTPHPGIVERRSSDLQVDIDRGSTIEVDGRRVRAGRTLSVHLVADAGFVVV